MVVHTLDLSSEVFDLPEQRPNSSLDDLLTYLFAWCIAQYPAVIVRQRILNVGTKFFAVQNKLAVQSSHSAAVTKRFGDAASLELHFADVVEDRRLIGGTDNSERPVKRSFIDVRQPA